MKLISVTDIKHNCNKEYQYTLLVFDTIDLQGLKNEFGEALPCLGECLTIPTKNGRLIIDKNKIKFFAFHSTGLFFNKKSFLERLNNIIE